MLGFCIILTYYPLLYDNFMEVIKNTLNSGTLPHYILTERELEYLSLAALGCKNKEIAAKLFVSCSTVKKTFETVFRKLYAPNKTNAVTKALIVGLLNPCILKNMQDKYYGDTLN